MKKFYFSFGLILFVFINLTIAQDFDIPLMISDDNNSTTVYFGVDPLGTDGTDTGLDTLAPPPPPGGFDVRFKMSGVDYLTDIRDNSIVEKQFHLDYQPELGNIVVRWNSLHLDSLGTFFIVDDILGTLFGPIDMTTIDSLIVTDLLILDKLRILVTPFEWVSAPSSLTAKVFDSPWRVELNWMDNSDNELGFVIARDDTNSAGLVDIDTVSANITTYTDTNVDAVFKYIYKVYAYSADKISDFSDAAQVIVPVELKSFTASLSGNSITILWTTSTELNNRGFELERMIDKVWEKIAFIEGNGTTTDESTYQFIDEFKNISVKGIVQYRLKQIDFNGTYEYSDVVEVNVDFTPSEYVLYQNYPNPFNPGTKITYALPLSGKVVLTVYSMIGEAVAVLVDEIQVEGFHEIDFDASSAAGGLPSGIYLYRLVANENIQVKKMILLK